MQVLRCALCLTENCLHEIPEGEVGSCQNRLAETLLTGTALCGPCAKARVQIEVQLMLEERERDAASQNATQAGSEAAGSQRDGILRDRHGRIAEDLIGDEFG